MNQATSEISIAGREQAQAFDQLGTQVLGLSGTAGTVGAPCRPGQS